MIMEEIITKTDVVTLSVKTTMTPGFRTVTIRCIEQRVDEEVIDDDMVVLLDRGEVERVIKALQNTLDKWDESNGLS